MKKTTISAMTLSAILASFIGSQSLHAEETNPDGSAVTSAVANSVGTGTSSISTTSTTPTSVVSTSNSLNNTSSSGSVVPTNTAAMRSTYDAIGGSMAQSSLNSMTSDNTDQSSLVADAYTTPQWSDANNSWGTSVVKGANNSTEAGGCDPAVSSGLMANQLQEIAGAKSLAAQTITPPPQGIFSKLMESGCLPGLGGSSSFPGLSALKQIPEMLANQVCQAAQSMEQNYISQYVTSPISSLSQNANIDLGSIGGYSLGSVPLGVQISANSTTGQGGSPITFTTDAAQTAKGLGLPNIETQNKALQSANANSGDVVHNGFISSMSANGTYSGSSGGTTSSAVLGLGGDKLITSSDGSMRIALPGE